MDDSLWVFCKACFDYFAKLVPTSLSLCSTHSHTSVYIYISYMLTCTYIYIHICICIYILFRQRLQLKRTDYTRRKFRSQTSDNMDRRKSRGGKSQRREEKKRQDQRREGVRRKKIQVREEVGKSREAVFFQWFVALEGRKVGSLKRRVRSNLARWEMKNCTPLWREALFESKCTKHLSFGALLEGEMTKSARRCGVKHISKPKFTKHSMLGPLLEVATSKKCTLLWREAQFEVKSVKNCRVGALLDLQMSFCVAGARDYAPCQQWAKREGFCRVSKNDGRRGEIAEDLQRCIVRGRRSTRDMFIRDVRRLGRWFPERGSGLPRWFCVTGAALRMTWHHFFVAGAVL